MTLEILIQIPEYIRFGIVVKNGMTYSEIIKEYKLPAEKCFDATNWYLINRDDRVVLLGPINDTTPYEAYLKYAISATLMKLLNNINFFPS